MRTHIFTIAMGLAITSGVISAQDNDITNKPSVTLENKEKPPKEGNSRTIEGLVHDTSENPLANAIVQLKDMKTSKTVELITKSDGKFVFRDLYMDVNYELLAKRNDVTTPVKKVSIYDNRKDVVVNFELPSAAKQQ